MPPLQGAASRAHITKGKKIRPKATEHISTMVVGLWVAFLSLFWLSRFSCLSWLSCLSWRSALVPLQGVAAQSVPLIPIISCVLGCLGCLACLGCLCCLYVWVSLSLSLAWLCACACACAWAGACALCLCRLCLCVCAAVQPATWCYIFSSFFVRMSGPHVVAPSGGSLTSPRNISNTWAAGRTQFHTHI